LIHFATSMLFSVRGCLPHAQPPSWRTTLLLVVCGCLLNIFAANLHCWRLSLPSATWGHAMLWWQRDPPNMEKTNNRHR
jgi:hypothetical protein